MLSGNEIPYRVMVTAVPDHLNLGIDVKKLIFSFLSLILSSQVFSASMKLEGSCSGTLQNGTAVTFDYYSDFDGCKEKSQAALSLTSGMEGLHTGHRSFQNAQDIYSFAQIKLTFKDSTGNTSGSFRYLDEANTYKTIQVQCEIRDYEYGECF